MRTLLAGLFGCALIPVSPQQLNGQEPTANVRPEMDDASLRSVFCTTADHGCAVGSHGVIWRTADGGRTWSLVPSPVAGLHEAVTFVDGKHGWIVGSQTMPGNHLPLGYVLATVDGGATWALVAGRPARGPDASSDQLRYLPRLRGVRFFTKQLGFAIGAANRFYPSGVLRTEDGGRTWEPVEGANAAWQCGWFMNPETGFMAGRLSRRGSMQGQRVLVDPNQLAGLQTWRSMKVTSTAPSWMVGDGARVLFSADGGITWTAPPAPLPEALSRFVDFHAVASRQQRVWIAGSPGSVVFHSADGGRTWVSQSTGHTATIRGLHFVDAQRGWAVCDLGVILATTDGGQSWTAQRAAARRIALLAASPRATRVPFDTLVAESGERGYRAAILLPARPDVRPGPELLEDHEELIREAALQVFASGAEYSWRFPITVPGADHLDDRLVADWQQRTEGQLGHVLLANFVSTIRAWRPDVIVLDHVAADDAVARIINEGLLRAVKLAGDPQEFPEQTRLTHLQPWQVKRVFQRAPDGSRGSMQVHRRDVLHLRGGTVAEHAGPAMGLATRGRTQAIAGGGYRRIHPPADSVESLGGFFRGLSLPPGSEARRPMIAAETDRDTLVELAARQRNFDGYVEKFIGDQRMAAQLLAQLGELTQGFPDRMAARQLSGLAEEYQQVQKWRLAAATRLDLVKRYPDTPEASDAREWLIHWWSAVEPSWQAQRRMSVRSEIAKSGIGPGQPDPLTRLVAPASAVDEAPITFDPVQLAGGQNSLRSDVLANHRESALRLAANLRATDPLRFQTSGFQMSLASLLRTNGKRAEALAIYGRHNHAPEWKSVAAREVWLDQAAGEPPAGTVTLRRALSKPVLDAVLSDECWQAAKEMWLRGDDLDSRQGSFTALAFDDEYLYLAGSIRRHPSTAEVVSKPGARDWDADAGNHDRVRFAFDTDRDYATWYELQIDQRGFTADKCWENRSWNPKWFVAVDSDESHWRFEAAIPLSELVPASPGVQDAWAIGVTRMLPGYGVSSWNLPATEMPSPQTFGVAIFGR